METENQSSVSPCLGVPYSAKGAPIQSLRLSLRRNTETPGKTLLSLSARAPPRPYNPGRPVALTPGTRLGVYEVIAQIGAGGMGEVYRARDTKLGRSVAVKVLPEAWAEDPERIARLEREAKVLASLNHHNPRARTSRTPPIAGSAFDRCPISK